MSTFFRKNWFWILPIFFMFFWIGVYIYEQGKAAREYAIYKNGKINKCVIENKQLPNPKDVCTSAFQLGQLNDK